MNPNEHHVHHLAKRLHAAYGKIGEITASTAERAKKFASTGEVLGGAFLGGLIEGKSQGAALFGHIPYNLLFGTVALAAGHFSDHLNAEAAGPHINNFANGLLGSYVSSKAFALGERWHNGGSLKNAILPGGAGTLAPPAPVAVQGEVNAAQMQSMVDRMNQAAVQR